MTPTQDSMPTQRFFIIGCQRSGTTLMRLMLDSHPRIYCADEMKGYDLFKHINPEACLRENHNVEWLGFKLPRFTEQLLRTTFSDGKFHFSMPNRYQGDPLIFMIRDVRDVIASMQNLLVTPGQTWLQVYAVPIIHFWIEHSPTFKARYADDIHFIQKESQFPDLATAALYWKMKNDALFEYQAAGLPVLPIRMREVIYDSRNTMQRILTHIGAPWHESVLQHHIVPHDEVDQLTGFTVGRTNSQQPLTDRSIGRYASFFHSDQLQEITHIAGKTMKKLYPEFTVSTLALINNAISAL